MNTRGTVLILENERELLGRLEPDMASLGYRFVRGQLPVTDVVSVSRLTPSAVLLGLTQWDDDRLNACETLLSGNVLPPEIPVIALISESILRKVSRSLDFADIIILPYRLPEMDFRLDRTIFRYRLRAEQDVITIGDLSISLSGYEVRVKDELIALTLKEYELLKYLVINRGRVHTRDTLLNTIWGYDYYGGTRTVDVHIRRVRAKIGDIDETYIKTVRGVGYTFRNDPLLPSR